jgi:hypothetical protein
MVAAQTGVVRGDLGARAFDRLRDAYSCALGGSRCLAVVVTQPDRSCQLVREEVEFRGEPRCPLGVAPTLGLVELFAQVGESLAVGGLRLG